MFHQSVAFMSMQHVAPCKLYDTLLNVLLTHISTSIFNECCCLISMLSFLTMHVPIEFILIPIHVSLLHCVCV